MNAECHSIKLLWDNFVCRMDGDQSESDKIFEQIKASYNTPPREYHSLGHVYDCLIKLQQFVDMDTSAIELAIWFHDAVYDALSKTNECDSANMMKQCADHLRIDPIQISDADRLIMITADHKNASKNDEIVIADIDLSILAADPDVYKNYTMAIRSEYKAIDDIDYRAGRSAFLQQTLDSMPLFHTKWAQSHGFDDRAKENITRELITLAN